MAIAIEMPKMSDTMEEGVLVAWLVEEGAPVEAGDVIAQVETDKATMDLEVYDDGVLLRRVIDEGASVPIGALIAVLGKEGESADEMMAKYGGDGAASPAPASPTAPTATPAPSSDAPSNDAPPSSVPIAAAGAVPEGYGHQEGGPAPSAPTASAPPATASPATAAPPASAEAGGRVKASPLARRMAEDAGIDLASVAGSGPDGRVIKRDVEAAMQSGSAPKPAGAQSVQPVAPAAQPVQPAQKEAPKSPAAPQRVAAPGASDGGYESLPLSQMRKAIARRLAQSKFTAPHFYLTIDVDMAEATAFRKQMNALAAEQDKGRVSFNDLVTKASALALREHPDVNASWMEAEGEIRRHEGIHVAVAVAIPDGLITPVVRHADRKGLAAIGAETRELAGKAKGKKLQPHEFEGSTFSTSNLGMFGIEAFTAIINPPNAAILAIGAIRDEAVVENGEVVAGKRMKLSLSCDHRAIDGAMGAQFLQTLKGFLEQPVTMLL